MEQAVECSNHPDKKAIRLCDDCGNPFCTECLRKNPLGFYYCQNCYPALFKGTSAQRYEIPPDEKGLKKILNKPEPQEDFAEKLFAFSKYTSYIKIGIIIGAGLLLLNIIIFYFLILITFASGIGLLIPPYTYYLAGRYCGKRLPEYSWNWGYWLTTPLLVLVVMALFAILISNPSSYEGRIFSRGLPIFTIIYYFAILLASCIGAKDGARASKKKEIERP